jgi:hypothetical protein
MFSATIPRVIFPYSADSNLFAIGSTTWQTKNITAVSIGEQSLTFVEPEPRHVDPKPVQTTNWKALGIGLAAIFMFTVGREGGLVLSLALLLPLIGLIWFLRFYGHRNNQNEWSERKIEVTKARETWLALRGQVPKVYTLILDSSSGKSVALTTFKVEKIKEVEAAILFAMSSDSNESLSGSIEALSLGTQNLAEMYANYCARQMSTGTAVFISSKKSMKTHRKRLG